MKKYTITGMKGGENDAYFELEKVTVEGDDALQVSDGFHTMDELYAHRIALYIELCKRVNKEDEMDKSMRAFKEGFAFDASGWIRKVWRSKLHADGKGYDGWYILGINKEKGEQISYHLPNSTWNDTGFAETLDRAPEWDGHTPANVIHRLKDI